MSEDFLGTGWQLPIKPDASNHIGVASGEDCVQQAIWMILSTAPGERVMRPDFGCGIHDLVFSTGGAETSGYVVSLVRQALARWEPRVEVLDVRAGPDDGDSSMLLIAIEYRIRATNTRANLVYPFYAHVYHFYAGAGEPAAPGRSVTALGALGWYRLEADQRSMAEVGRYLAGDA